MDIELGIIEGFYGRPWSWEQREDTVSWLAPHGYRFYMYAPKADPFLRRRWQEDHPGDTAERLKRLAGKCRTMRVRFGIGLSPYEAYNDFNAAARERLRRKLAFFDEIAIDDLAILFDDMRGDTPDLARRQVEIVHWAQEHTAATRVIMCPSYYTDDPILDRLFGARPEGYVEQLGTMLDPAVDVFWTGEEVIAEQFSPGHIERVAEQLRRKPFLWDNYPVNDGQRMSQYLHLRAFTGRPATLRGNIRAHGINVALQPTLTRIPALTLVESYEKGDDYQYAEAFSRAAVEVLGEQLGMRVREDLLTLQDLGLDRLGEKDFLLRERYGGLEHPGAREIIAWLDGEYRITDEIVQAQ